MTRMTLALVALAVASCGGGGTLQVLLTDNPLDDATAVNVSVAEVSAHYAGDGESGDWVTVLGEERAFDLLELRGGVRALLGELTLPPGKMTQIRLLLGTAVAPSLVNASGEHALSVPSGYESGIKINACFGIERGETTTVTLDFDARASVSGDAEVGYTLRPVLRIVEEPTCGDEPAAS